MTDKPLVRACDLKAADIDSRYIFCPSTDQNKEGHNAKHDFN